MGVRPNSTELQEIINEFIRLYGNPVEDDQPEILIGTCIPYCQLTFERGDGDTFDVEILGNKITVSREWWRVQDKIDASRSIRETVKDMAENIEEMFTY